MSTPKVIRCLALTVLWLAAPACDSGDPVLDEPTLVGAWSAQSRETATYVTVSQTQSARDPSRAGTDGLMVSGDVTGALRYVSGYFVDGDVNLCVSDRGCQSEDARLSLEIERGGIRVYAADPTGGGRQHFDLVSFGGPTPYTLSADAIALTAARFVDPFTGEEAVLNGRLVFARLPLTANQEALVGRSAYVQPTSNARSITFDDGGAYRQVDLGGNAIGGTWAADADTVRVRVYDVTRMHAFDVDAATLTLSADDAQGVCGAQCRQTSELYLGLLPGTLVTSVARETLTFSRDPDGGRLSGSP